MSRCFSEEDFMDSCSSQDGSISFQGNIRLPKHELMASANTRLKEYVMPKLYDHRPLKLSDRVRKIPKRKGANDRNFPGVEVEFAVDVCNPYLHQCLLVWFSPTSHIDTR
ncbi:hypothetical protein MKX03_017934 [Papaver bracteatum]|nr:hypothetical protein MKX03_017934 [Papaver bracteatum]